MRRIVLLLSIFFLTSSMVSGDIVGMWLFEEGDGDIAVDISESEHEIELLFGFDWVNGKFGQGVSLEADGFMELKHHEDFSFPDAYTMMIWANISEITPQEWVGLPRKEGEYVLAAHKGAEIEMTMWVNVGGWQGPIPGLGSGIATGYDEWHHYASTYDGDVCRVFVDGEEAGSQKVGGPISGGTDPVRISNTCCGRFMVAAIDEFVLANEAFTQDQIKEFMSKGIELTLAVEPGSKLAITWGAVKQ